MKEEQLKQLWQLHNSLVADLLHAKQKIKQLQELIKDLERFEPADHYNNGKGKQ
jgi:Tfp pilus assembly protein PilO